MPSFITKKTLLKLLCMWTNEWLKKLILPSAPLGRGYTCISFNSQSGFYIKIDNHCKIWDEKQTCSQ